MTGQPSGPDLDQLDLQLGEAIGHVATIDTALKEASDSVQQLTAAEGSSDDEADLRDADAHLDAARRHVRAARRALGSLQRSIELG
jgi:hypothetical protein